MRRSTFTLGALVVLLAADAVAQTGAETLQWGFDRQGDPCDGADETRRACEQATEAYYGLLADRSTQELRLGRARREANRVEERNAERQLERIDGELPGAKQSCDAAKQRADQKAGQCPDARGCRGCPGYSRSKASGATGTAQTGADVGSGYDPTAPRDPQAVETATEILDVPLFGGGDRPTGRYYEGGEERRGTGGNIHATGEEGWVRPE